MTPGLAVALQCDSCAQELSPSDVLWNESPPVMVCPSCGARRVLALASAHTEEPQEGYAVPPLSSENDPGENERAQRPPESVGPVAAAVSGAPVTALGPSRSTEVASADSVADRLSLSQPAQLASGPPRGGLPPVLCPKCGHRQVGELACDRCGLVFGTVHEGREPWLRLKPGQGPELERAERLWANVAVADLDPQRHSDFIQHCLDTDLVDHGVRVYRMTIAGYPEHPELQRGLERLTEKAHMRVLALQPSREKAGVRGSARYRMMLIGVSIVVVIIALMVMMNMVRGMVGALDDF